MNTIDIEKLKIIAKDENKLQEFVKLYNELAEAKYEESMFFTDFFMENSADCYYDRDWLKNMNECVDKAEAKFSAFFENC